MKIPPPLRAPPLCVGPKGPRGGRRSNSDFQLTPLERPAGGSVNRGGGGGFSLLPGRFRRAQCGCRRRRATSLFPSCGTARQLGVQLTPLGRPAEGRASRGGGGEGGRSPSHYPHGPAAVQRRPPSERGAPRWGANFQPLRAPPYRMGPLPPGRGRTRCLRSMRLPRCSGGASSGAGSGLPPRKGGAFPDRSIALCNAGGGRPV